MDKKEIKRIAQKIYDAGFRLYGYNCVLADTSNETTLRNEHGLDVMHFADGYNRDTSELDRWLWMWLVQGSVTYDIEDAVEDLGITLSDMCERESGESYEWSELR